MRLIIFFLIGYIFLSLVRALLRTRIVVKNFHYNNYNTQPNQPSNEGKITIDTSHAKNQDRGFSGKGGEYVDYEEVK